MTNTHSMNTTLESKIKSLIKDWENNLKEFEVEMEEWNRIAEEEPDDYDDHEVDNLQGHIECLESRILGLKELLK